jgi:hypothetical protein
MMLNMLQSVRIMDRVEGSQLRGGDGRAREGREESSGIRGGKGKGGRLQLPMNSSEYLIRRQMRLRRFSMIIGRG